MNKYTPQEAASIIKTHGFNLVAVAQIEGENTYYFNSLKEADRAWGYFILGQNTIKEPLLEDGLFLVEDEMDYSEFGTPSEIQYV